MFGISSYLSMMKAVHNQVSIIASYNASTGQVAPRRMRWHNRDYSITSVSSHYPVRRGRRLYHYFAAHAGGFAFTLVLDTESLRWTLEEMEDGWPPAPHDEYRQWDAC